MVPVLLITFKYRYSFKWQYMTGAGAEAGAEIMDNGGARKEPEQKINNFGSPTLGSRISRAGAAAAPKVPGFTHVLYL